MCSQLHNSLAPSGAFDTSYIFSIAGHEVKQTFPVCSPYHIEVEKSLVTSLTKIQYRTTCVALCFNVATCVGVKLVWTCLYTIPVSSVALRLTQTCSR